MSFRGVVGYSLQHQKVHPTVHPTVHPLPKNALFCGFLAAAKRHNMAQKKAHVSGLVILAF
jgi:hypothetical protein